MIAVLASSALSWQVAAPAAHARCHTPCMVLEDFVPQLQEAWVQLTEAFSTVPDATEALVSAAQAGDAEAAAAAALSIDPEVPAVAAVGAVAVSVADAQMPAPPVELLKGTILDGRPLRLAYKGSRDGWSATKFHGKVDFEGPALVLGATRTSVFGGFNPNGWLSTDDYCMPACGSNIGLAEYRLSLHLVLLSGTDGSINAFLFVQKGGEWVKLRKIGGGEAAIFDYARSGPQFGAGELVIGATQAPVMGGFSGPDTEDIGTAEGNLRRASSRLGLSYERGPPPFRASVFGGATLEASLRELEVWVAADGGKKRAPFRTSRI